MFKVAVCASSEASFREVSASLHELGFLTDQIVFADSSRLSRLDVINQHIDQWLFFIDHDCRLSFAHQKQIESLIQLYQAESTPVVSGLYLNPKMASQLQRAHNWIANTWVELSYQLAKQPVLLGGCFLVRVQHKISGELPHDLWGAEDKKLAQILHQNKATFHFHPEVQVLHETNGHWGHFLRRAWLHGQNDVEGRFEFSGGRRYSGWLKKIVSADFDLIGLILLHFCIQKTAKQVQLILRKNKLRTLK